MMNQNDDLYTGGMCANTHNIMQMSLTLVYKQISTIVCSPTFAVSSLCVCGGGDDEYDRLCLCTTIIPYSIMYNS